MQATMTQLVNQHHPEQAATDNFVCGHLHIKQRAVKNLMAVSNKAITTTGVQTVHLN